MKPVHKPRIARTRDAVARCALLTPAIGVALLLAAPIAGAANSGRVDVVASYTVRAGHVTAHGVVIRGGAAASARSKSRVELEEQVVSSSSGSSEWHVCASAGLASRGRRSAFTIRLRTSKVTGTVRLRTSLISSSRVLSRSPARTLRLGPALVVKSVLRATTAQDPAGVVQSVSGSPSGTQTAVLARGAKVPRIGGVLVLGVSAHAPDGLLGVATAVSHGAGGTSSVTTRPATLEEAYSSFDAQINGTLGELATEDTSAAAHAADVSIGSFADVAFSCEDPGVQHSITHTIDLSELHVSSEIVIPSWSNGFSGPFINFDLGGHPKFGLGVSFGGYASCTADATVNIPLADTGLFVEIGPQFTLGASGAVSVNMDWEPWVNYGFSRGRGDPSNNYEAFHNDGHTTFSGNADLSVSLALKAGISLAGRLGVGGTIGPEITGEVSASTATRAACLAVDAEVVAELTAYADVFFDDYNFTLGRFAFGHTQLYTSCTSPGGGGGSGGGGSGGSGGGGGSTGSPPANSAPPTITDEEGNSPPKVDDTLRATTGSWSGVPTAYSYSWEDCKPATVCAVTGSSRATHVVTPSEKGDTVRVSVTALNAAGSSLAATSTETGVVEGTGGGVGNPGADTVSMGTELACAALSTGGADCWGDNFYGQLGIDTSVGPETCEHANGNFTSSPCSTVPVAVRELTEVEQVAAGDTLACALRLNRTVDCWGYSADGGLGDGSFTGSEACDRVFPCSPTAVLVSGLTDAIQISVGDSGACALLDGGSIDCWGWNDAGQLGNGTNAGPETCGDFACSSSPVAVAGITDAIEVSVGQEFACAVLITGSIKCWGINGVGQLGDGTHAGNGTCHAGTPECEPTPVSVSGITDATQVSTGVESACARLADGGIDCWGSDEAAQLGNGFEGRWNPPEDCGGEYPDFKGCSTVPTAVDGIGDAVQVAASAANACALLSSGSVDCWGGWGEGALGYKPDHDTELDCAEDGYCTEPAPVTGLTNATQISAGSSSACARLATESVECWGDDYEGQLGNGDPTIGEYPNGPGVETPQLVSGLG
jgi:alpha-tubulin suppressor-like RCC1 family protein